MLHVTRGCHRCCALLVFEIQDGGYVFCTLSKSKLKAFLSKFPFENVGNRTKTGLVTLIALNTRNLSKILRLLSIRLYLRFKH